MAPLSPRLALCKGLQRASLVHSAPEERQTPFFLSLSDLHKDSKKKKKLSRNSSLLRLLLSRANSKAEASISHFSLVRTAAGAELSLSVSHSQIPEARRARRPTAPRAGAPTCGKTALLEQGLAETSYGKGLLISVETMDLKSGNVVIHDAAITPSPLLLWRLKLEERNGGGNLVLKRKDFSRLHFFQMYSRHNNIQDTEM